MLGGGLTDPIQELCPCFAPIHEDPFARCVSAWIWGQKCPNPFRKASILG